MDSAIWVPGVSLGCSVVGVISVVGATGVSVSGGGVSVVVGTGVFVGFGVGVLVGGTDVRVGGGSGISVSVGSGRGRRVLVGPRGVIN